MSIVIWAVLFGSFLLFVSLRHREGRLPAALFLAYGVLFAVSAPAGAHPVSPLFPLSILVGGSLIVAGWALMRNDYWSHEDRTGRLVTKGAYRIMRHPQYCGYLLVSMGALMERRTMVLVLIWPLLPLVYYRLARREEQYLEEEFGLEWRRYAARTGMFLPRPGRNTPGHNTPKHNKAGRRETGGHES
ncbi:MAG: isoprenylcysteine carboxylmethyltransferase family protein [Spirochaetaceae bacterium]|nr:MAG: isoprenylcysteine carboxylmethyltransferase family protein [Spirochaetaceae bacterium]